MADTGEELDLKSSDSDSDGHSGPHYLVTKAFSATHQIILSPLIQMPVGVIAVALFIEHTISA